MFIKNRINQKGFTLIELLVVISIIALLSSVIMASLNNARAKARDAKRLSEIREINKAIQLFVADNGRLPYPYGQPSCVIPYYEGNCSISDYQTEWQTSLGAQLQPYLKKIGTDPCGEKCPKASNTLFFLYYYQTIGNVGASDFVAQNQPQNLNDLSYSLGASSLETSPNNRGYNIGFGSI